MADRIKEKRDEELGWLWKLRVQIYIFMLYGGIFIADFSPETRSFERNSQVRLLSTVILSLWDANKYRLDISFFIPSVCMVVSYATYTVIMKQDLTRQ